MSLRFHQSTQDVQPLSNIKMIQGKEGAIYWKTHQIYPPKEVPEKDILRTFIHIKKIQFYNKCKLFQKSLNPLNK